MSDRVIDIVVRVLIILILLAGFHIMKREHGFETAVLFAFAVTIAELYTKTN